MSRRNEWGISPQTAERLRKSAKRIDFLESIIN